MWMKKRLLIVYHSQSGATARLAAAVCEGARREDGVEVILRRAWDAGMDDLLQCDAVALGAAENSGSVAGAMKDFLDRTYYPAQPRQLNLAYGLFISAGNDGRGAVAQMQRILSGYPLKQVCEPLICRGEVNPQALARCEELGQTLAAGLAFGIF
ncbi:MAG: flavodoxin [Gammaproteobacteria bacterium]|nr:flavodoxin [Gammaproteobacteria bacterium]